MRLFKSGLSNVQRYRARAHVVPITHLKSIKKRDSLHSLCVQGKGSTAHSWCIRWNDRLWQADESDNICLLRERVLVWGQVLEI